MKWRHSAQHDPRKRAIPDCFREDENWFWVDETGIWYTIFLPDYTIRVRMPDRFVEKTDG